MAEPTTKSLRRIRRDLHRIPELDFELPKTLAYITAALSDLQGPVHVFSPCRSTLCCLFDVGAPTTVAVRTDMDALPITERTGAPYASRHEGRMHACGHDGHMAMALGLAQYLDAHRQRLSQNVLIVFQPAEETTGGARVVCESGVFTELGVERIYGFHLWPDLPKGEVATRPGALLAASNETTVTFFGRASHIAKAEQGADALDAAARFCSEAYELVERATTLEEPCLLKFGRMEAGTVRNQIAAQARLEGSLRTFSIKTRDSLMDGLRSVAEARAGRHGCSVEVAFSDGYPPVVNDRALYEEASKRLGCLGLIERPLLIAEDFAWYQQYLPGLFLLLGTGTGIPLHADTFDFDESLLDDGVRTYLNLLDMC